MNMHARWYVYELVDPMNGEVFYVGKGTGDRMHHHGKDKSNKEKQNRILLIGYSNVIRRKIAEFWDETAAYNCETDRIRMYNTLTNIAKVVGKLSKPKVKYVYFFKVVFDLIKRKNIENNKLKLVEYFPRQSLPTNEYRMLFDAAFNV